LLLSVLQAGLNEEEEGEVGTKGADDAVCARDEAAQAADEHLANLTAAAASAYSLPPPAPAEALLMSEDPLVFHFKITENNRMCIDFH